MRVRLSDIGARCRVVLRYLVLGLVLVAPVPEGARSILSASSFAMIAALLAATTVLAADIPRRTGWVWWLSALLLGLATIWLLLQAMAFEGNPLANPAWQAAAEIIGPLPGAISLQPAETRATIAYFALPALVFMAMLQLFPDDARALSALRIVAYGGGLFALLAIVLRFGFPESNLFYEKVFFRDALTGTFVGRNTAATYLGVATLALFLQVILSGREVDWRAARDWLLGRRRRLGTRIPRGFIIATLLLLVALVALLLTKSRAGVGLGLATLALTGAAIFLAAPMRQSPLRGFAAGSRRVGRRLLLAGAWVMGVAMVGALLAVQTALRFAAQGTEDIRLCHRPAIIEATLAYWPWGAGAGTFAESFQPFRDPACGLSSDFIRAYNLYLEVALGAGAPGLAILLIAIVTVALIFVFGIRNRRSLRAAPIVGLAVLAFISAHAAIEFSLQIPGMSVYAAAVLAPLVTLSLAGGRAAARKSADT